MYRMADDAGLRPGAELLAEKMRKKAWPPRPLVVIMSRIALAIMMMHQSVIVAMTDPALTGGGGRLTILRGTSAI